MPELQIVKTFIPSGRQLRAIRTWYGLTQAELAERANVSKSSIEDYEKGIRKTSLPTLNAVAIALHKMKIKFKDGSPILPE